MGVNFAIQSIKPNDDEKPNGRTSFHTGALVEIPIAEKFAIQPEILFSSLGVKSKDSGERWSEELTLKMNYLNFPVMAKYYVINGLAIELGPKFGFLVSAKADYEYTESAHLGSQTIDLKDLYKKRDVGLGIGTSYTLDMGIFFGVRYVLGLTDISDDKETDFDASIKIKNNEFQISAGYKF